MRAELVSIRKTRVNLIPDGDFEIGVGGWELINNATIAASTSTLRTGARSCTVTTGALSTNDGALKRGVKVTDNTRYRFIIWVRGQENANYTMAWDENDSGGGYLRTQSQTIAVVSGQWKRFVLEKTTGNSAATLNLYVLKPTSAGAVVFHLDDARLERV